LKATNLPTAVSAGYAVRPAPRIRFQDLRHTCATILLIAGKHPKYVQELLGHASISITLDTYSHVIEGMDGGLADIMDDAL
jgi:integrase